MMEGTMLNSSPSSGGQVMPCEASRLPSSGPASGQYLCTSPNPTEPYSQSRLCAGCGGPIEDPMMLSAVDRFWHTGCLKCSCCRSTLDDLGPSFFTRDNMILCRRDYFKMFGTTGTCSGCGSTIPPEEMVMRCQASVYHVKCFVCSHCHTPLQTGDRFSVLNGSLVCEHEFPRLFGSTTTSLHANGPLPTPTPTGKGRQKKVDSRRYSLNVY